MIGTVASLASAGLNASKGNLAAAALDVAGAIPGAGTARGAVRGAEALLDVARVEQRSATFWTKAEFNGTRVYQRNDLIDPMLVDARNRSNLDRMRSGLAPIGSDGKSINLHHTIQTADSPLAEMTATFHQQNSSVIHINPNTIPSGIDRNSFDAFRKEYWINRSKDF